METEYSKYEPLFGSWKIKELLGEGSYGKVYEIEREDFGTTYRSALKAITIPKNRSDVESVISEGMDEESASTYFKSFVTEITNEISLMDKIKGNSNFVNYEDHVVIEHKDDIGWDILIRMEILTPLNTYLKSHTLSVEDIVNLGIDLCKALEICDKYNIIHRDIKPENIFVSDLGVYKLGDFGIARVAEKTRGASTKVGTNSYMAPEIARGETYNSSVDQYSLGLVLYRLLNNNRLPFLPPAPAPITFSQREEANARRYKGEAFPQPAMADRNLSDIIAKATAYNPLERFTDAAQMRAALEDYLKGPVKESEPAPQKEAAKPVADDDDEDMTLPVEHTPVVPQPESPADSINENIVKEKIVSESETEQPYVNMDQNTAKFGTKAVIISAVAIVITAVASAIFDAISFGSHHFALLGMGVICMGIIGFILGLKGGLKRGIIGALIGYLLMVLVFSAAWAALDWGDMYYFFDSILEVFVEYGPFKKLLIPLAGIVGACIGGQQYKD